MPDNRSDLARVTSLFDATALSKICTLPERTFGRTFGMAKTVIKRAPARENYYYHRDNGSNVLAVAHLDTVGLASQRAARFVQTEGGPVVFSRALDDRLGAYIVLDLLPKLGITYDVLLTVGEESGNSTAQYFDAAKQYDWMIEFDRGGTDVVMYDYEDDETYGLVREAGARVGQGSFSDICYLDHLAIKGFNWGVGYRDYHGPRAHAFLDDTTSMVAKYVRFHEQNEGLYMPHYPLPAAPPLVPAWEDDVDYDNSMLGQFLRTMNGGGQREREEHDTEGVSYLFDRECAEAQVRELALGETGLQS